MSDDALDHEPMVVSWVEAAGGSTAKRYPHPLRIRYVSITELLST